LDYPQTVGLTMAEKKKKSLMRSLGEFVGHVAKGVKTDPAAGSEKPKRTEVKRTVEEREDEHGVVYRRTTIDEIEIQTPEKLQDEAPVRDDSNQE
jgi:hypothetical protein